MPLAGAVPPVGAWHPCVLDPACVPCWELCDQRRELQDTWAPSCCGGAVCKPRFVQLARNLEVFVLHDKNALLLHSPVKCGGDPEPQPGLELFLMTFMAVRLEKTSQTKRSFPEEDL